MTRRVWSSGLLTVLLGAPAWAEGPAGPLFVVNSHTTGSQGFPSVSVDPSGAFVVAWQSLGPDGSDYGVAGRRFSPSGTPLGPEFQVNGYTPSRQSRAGVATDSTGAFVVAWDSWLQDGSSYGIRARRYDPQGNPLAGEFAVNTYTNGQQWYPVIASNPAGRFAVVWESLGEDGSGLGIFGRMHDETGTPLGSGFQFNLYTSGDQSRPSVGMDAAGNVIAVYSSPGVDGWGTGILYRRFNWNGTPAGSFVVNSSTVDDQRYPSIAVGANGEFVVAWSSYYRDGSYSAIVARRFDSSAIALGPDFLVNTYTTGGQTRPRVTLDAAGNFVVVWLSVGQDGDGNGLFGQRFDAGGNPVGGEFPVTAYTSGAQYAAAVAAAPDGDFVVTWSSQDDGDQYGIFGQRFGDLISEDGFETGDLAGWSSAATDGGDLSASGAAALAGTGVGLQGLVDDTASVYVQDNRPLAENRYRARFYLDPNTLDPGEASAHFRVRVFIAFNASTQRLFTLVLKRQGGAYSLMARVRRDDGSRMDAGFFPISNAPHLIECDWRRATAPGANDGQFSMWIDETPVATLAAIDNDSSPVEFARMGLMSVKTGASGLAYFDQFEARRQLYIGPE